MLDIHSSFLGPLYTNCREFTSQVEDISYSLKYDEDEHVQQNHALECRKVLDGAFELFNTCLKLRALIYQTKGKSQQPVLLCSPTMDISGNKTALECSTDMAFNSQFQSESEKLNK